MDSETENIEEPESESQEDIEFHELTFEEPANEFPSENRIKIDHNIIPKILMSFLIAIILQIYIILCMFT